MTVDISPGCVRRHSSVDLPHSMSIPKFAQLRAATDPDGVMVERKSQLGDVWLPITAREYVDQMRNLAAGFIAEGVAAGDRVALFAATSYEWTLTDMALQAVGACVVPIYESDSPSQIEWIMSDSGADRVVTQTPAQAAVVASVCGGVRSYVIDEGDLDRIADAGGRAELVAEVDRQIDNADPDAIATIVYTSGTTGRPRGVPLSNRNLTTMVLEAEQFFPTALHDRHVRMLLFLPQAHIYARTLGYMAMLGQGLCGHVPDTHNLVADFQSFKPTSIGAVPRVLEKIYTAVKAQANTRAKKIAFHWCEKVARQRAEYIRREEPVPAWLQARYAAARGVVFKKLESMFGGQMRYVASGGAPLSEQVEMFFTGMGIRIFNGYGMTETSGGFCCNTEDFARVGSVGVPMCGTSIRIADDGEVLVKCGGVFAGYNNEPPHDPEYFTPDGWFRTGDLGTIDPDGYLFIRGRKKEIIVTAGGKNVQPARVEDKVCGHPLVANTVAVGEGQRFIGALVTLDPDTLPGWLDSHGLPGMDVVASSKHPAVRAAIARAIVRANKQVSRAESIRKFTILPTAFTEANGLLTPSLKVKRARVYDRYATQIAALYAGAAAQGTDVPRE